MGYYSYGGKGTSLNGVLNYLRKIGIIDLYKLDKEEYQFIFDITTEFLKENKIKTAKIIKNRIHIAADINCKKVQDNWTKFVEFLKKHPLYVNK